MDKGMDKAADRLGLENFAAEVNKLAEARCVKMNAEFKAGKRLFGAKHYPYPARMLEHYYRDGYTAANALKNISSGG